MTASERLQAPASDRRLRAIPREWAIVLLTSLFGQDVTERLLVFPFLLSLILGQFGRDESPLQTLGSEVLIFATVEMLKADFVCKFFPTQPVLNVPCGRLSRMLIDLTAAHHLHELLDRPVLSIRFNRNGFIGNLRTRIGEAVIEAHR